MIKGFKKGFTLIELIFVIVVLGIVLGIVAEVISRMFSGYIEARTIDRLQSKTEVAVQQAASRLSYRVNPSTSAINPDDGTRIQVVDADDDYEILEWIGRDHELFRGTATSTDPVWSGFIDLEDSDASSVSTPGSNLTNWNGSGAIFFRGRMDDSDINRYYAQADTDASTHYGYPVSVDSDTRFNFDENYIADPNTGVRITLYEQYDLSTSAYALVPEDDILWLYYNYRPWAGESYNDSGVDRAILVDGLETFRFTQVGEVLRLKICAHESDGKDELIVCKEKAIL